MDQFELLFNAIPDELFKLSFQEHCAKLASEDKKLSKLLENLFTQNDTVSLTTEPAKVQTLSKEQQTDTLSDAEIMNHLLTNFVNEIEKNKSKPIRNGKVFDTLQGIALDIRTHFETSTHFTESLIDFANYTIKPKVYKYYQGTKQNRILTGETLRIMFGKGGKKLSGKAF